MNSKTFNIPIYKGKIIVCVHNNEFDALNDEYGVDHFNEHHWASTTYIDVDGHGCYLIAFNISDKDFPITHGGIAHEAVHVAAMKFDHCSVDKDIGNDEVEAYFVEWVVDRIYESLKEFNVIDKIS